MKKKSYFCFIIKFKTGSPGHSDKDNMTTSEINNSLIGKRVKGVFTAMGVTGTIISLVEDEYYAGVEVELDRPIVWGDYTYNKYQSTALKDDQFGNLKYTELI